MSQPSKYQDQGNRPPRLESMALIGLLTGMMVLLSACVSGEMPTPKYPIYMQDKPAEATQTVAQAGDDRPPPVTMPASRGEVHTSELAPPPPPPPPPPSNLTESSSASVAETAPVKDNRAAFVYVLQAHDTLYGVSRRFGVPVKELYEINGLAPDAGLRIGQKILLPANAVDKGVEEHANGTGMTKLAAVLAKPVTAPPTKPVPTKPGVASNMKPATPTETKPVVAPPVTPPVVAVTPPPPPPATSGFPSNAQISQMGRGLFVWPVKGKILVPFGQLAPNVRNDGINIGAEQGTEVKASSDGVVVYQGNQVKELGNTIYVKHANGWYTGYSHLDTMKVQNNEHVTKGEIIGTVGQTGVIDRPQLHFEIRYTPSTDIARPIDPNLVLPQ